jgi:CO/xanthine dehydrogenase Mo-binding subunit
MKTQVMNRFAGAAPDEYAERVSFDFGVSRRSFVQALGAGLLISVAPVAAQERRQGRREERSSVPIAERIHIGRDGEITVMTGKVEAGQGARAELTQAVAEELRVPVDRVRLIMADTQLVPDDGTTAGSGTTPRTVPQVRRACAAAREMLVKFASEAWSVEPETIDVHDAKIVHAASNRELSYADLAADERISRAFEQSPSSDVALTPVSEWKVLGTPVLRPNRRELVTGEHRYPSDIVRPGMMYGKVLRPPAFDAKLASIDLEPAKALPEVVVLRDGSFIGVVAPKSYLADQALTALAQTAQWERTEQSGSRELFEHLGRHANDDGPLNPFADELAQAAKVLRQSYQVAYVQHAPLEPRAAVAEWSDGRLTVWTGTQNPFGVRGELARALDLNAARVRVIVPDFGGGFGGKHSGEAAIEAARLAKATGRPVCLRWTRAEEFTWAYFRPAALIRIDAGLDANGVITSWYFVNINSGQQSIDTPYRTGKAKGQFIRSKPPLRHGSYRALAATANTFARECFMDELAEAAGRDPLEFRLAHLERGRLRDVLEAVGARFGWTERVKNRKPNIGVGLACGTEKGSYVAACAEVAVDRERGEVAVRHVCQTFDCGAILNPGNLLSQVQGAIVMGLGPALREEIQFENGSVTNAAFSRYRVPRFQDLPQLDVDLLDQRELPSSGAGETPIIAIAPAIANAVFHAIGTRVREMPIRLAKA